MQLVVTISIKSENSEIILHRWELVPDIRNLDLQWNPKIAPKITLGKASILAAPDGQVKSQGKSAEPEAIVGERPRACGNQMMKESE